MRQSWTDERLDDFKDSVDRRFDAVDRRFDEVDRRFDETNQRMESGFSRLDGRLDDLNRTLHQYAMVTFGVFATLIVGLFGFLLATQI